MSYDFKIGFYTMHDGEDQALNISDKINTLLAMCNANKGVNWLIGVADKEKDNVRHNTFISLTQKYTMDSISQGLRTKLQNSVRI